MPVKWGKEDLRAREELIASFDRRKGFVPFEGLSRAELDALKNQPFGQWLKTFLPEQFGVADAPFHAEADRRMDTVGIPVGNCWFGGAGKTWRYVVAKGLYRICHGTYICKRPDGTFFALPSHEANDPTRADIVSKRRIALRIVGARNLKKAAEKTVIMRLALKHSQELRAAYGDRILPTEGEDAEIDFTANGVRTVALGIESDLRGAMQVGGPRVQEVDLDDIENNDIAASKEREDKIEDQIFLGWMARCEANGTEAIFTAQMNQYRSRHCQARRWAKAAEERDTAGRPKCLFFRVALDDGEFHSNWPGRYTDDACKRLHFQFGPVRYDTEFRCREINEESLIQLEWLKTDFRVAGLKFPREDRWVFAACLDPSATEKETSDYKAIVALGKRIARPEIFTVHAWLKKLATPEEMLLHLLGLRKRFPGIYLGAESVGFQRLCWNLLTLLCDRDGVQVPRIWPIPSRGAKWDRIYENIAELARGVVHFDPTEGQQQLVMDQLVDGPAGKHDDGADSWDMARRLLTRAERDFRDSDFAAQEAEAEATAGRGPEGESWMSVENPALWQGVEIG